MWIITAAVLIIALFEYSVAGSCPPELATRPCKCKVEDNVVVLICANITDETVLEGVGRRTAGAIFDTFILRNSRIKSIPVSFSHHNLTTLQIEDSSLESLFDLSLCASNAITTISLLNVNFEGGFKWNEVKPSKKLRSLVIVRVTISGLDYDFKNDVSKDLEYLLLNETKIEKIDDDIFREFTKLVVVKINYSGLKTLKRSYFPSPCEISVLELNGNQIAILPDDIIEYMPHLKAFEVSNNEISEIPQTMFSILKHPLISIKIEGNPLNCGCNLRWILSIEKLNVYGNCETPARLKGKPLQNLTTADFICH
ncbi:LRRCT domain-containing protein [Caerostris extrusa]|uniref:LRRCT domain-containing protein n=1 Tax=Caerostris extrusa TaxID=172846 RepID=A0AAV4U1J0_CAEEX|nr:LRRCT domain-containing protein [Caerostris extrusa]